jgi:hypothetical protein
LIILSVVTLLHDVSSCFANVAFTSNEHLCSNGNLCSAQNKCSHRQVNPVIPTLREHVKHLDFGLDGKGCVVCDGCETVESDGGMCVTSDGVVHVDSDGVNLLISFFYLRICKFWWTYIHAIVHHCYKLETNNIETHNIKNKMNKSHCFLLRKN